jgi:hypothetical protein
MSEPVLVEVEKARELDPALVAILELKLKYNLPLNTTEAAAIMGDDPTTLVRKRVRGDGPPFVRIGRRVRYIPRPFLAWLTDRPLCRSTSEADAA